jgi:2-amino-4-hydroxy-6-hydroxymethyldihydropteridine diphosphokinase
MKEYITPFASIIPWCLMPNHFHWIVFVHRDVIEIQKSKLTPGDALSSRQGITKSKHQNKKPAGNHSHTLAESESMTRSADKAIQTRTINESIGILLRTYTRAIQKQEKFTGSLFQKHTKAKPLIDDIKIEPSYWNTTFGTQINISEGTSYLETCIEYIHQNPVSSQLVRIPEEWEFSSMRDFLGVRDGKLIDYNLLKEEKLLPDFAKYGDVLTSRQDITKSNTGRSSHTLAESESMTKTNTCIIGIGSNIDAEKKIAETMEILKSKLTILKTASLMRTKPIGIKNAPDFINGAVKIETELNRTELNKLLKNIEDRLGRDRTKPKFSSRCIDLDIIVWNNKVVDKDYYTRDFLQKLVDELIP